MVRSVRKVAAGGSRPVQHAATPKRREADERPLAWLRRRKDKVGQPMIDAFQFEAGERLRADYTFAQLMPSVTMSWRAEAGDGNRRSPHGGAADLQDAVIAARERVNRAMASVGPELSGILIDVCCHLKGLEAAERDRGWPLRSAKVVLQLGLTSLARHYGIGPAAPRTSARAPVRHWGSADYRPRIAKPPSETEPAADER